MAKILTYLTFAVVTILLVINIIGWRLIIKRNVKAEVVLSNDYQKKMMEFLPGLSHMGIQNMLENNSRAESGNIVHRPLGSSKKWPHLDEITFIPAQTTPFPIDAEENVDVKVTIGPNAKKPMIINIPLMISGMAYGIALSESARMSIVGAASKVGTAFNSGEGGILPEELDKAGKYILQFSKTDWSKDEEIIKRADMVEIKLGQGALYGVGARILPEKLTGKAREIMGLGENEDAVIYDNFFDNQSLSNIKDLVNELRGLTGGVPIGVKIGAGGKIEQDIDNLLQLGVDFIAIDGGQATTYEAAPILSDDMGIPTLHAVVRAANHLEKRNVKGKVSLIVSGGLLVPGHFLKVLALGADAVYIGSAILYTISHSQSKNEVPFEPPTQMVWDQGKFKDQFKVEDGVKSAERFLTSSTKEIKMALRAMGKRSLKELSKNDLVSCDQLTANMIGIPFSFEPWQDQQKGNN